MKNLQLIQLKKELLQLQTEVNDLDKNPFIQQKEIRKILGYAAADEIIFDFSNW
jgi:cell division protein FtsB